MTDIEKEARVKEIEKRFSEASSGPYLAVNNGDAEFLLNVYSDMEFLIAERFLYKSRAEVADRLLENLINELAALPD